MLREIDHSGNEDTSVTLDKIKRNFAELYGPLSIVSITADTAITTDHANKVLQVNSGSNVTLTLPADAPAGMSFIVDQVGAGLAIFAVASGATKVNRSSFDRTAGAGALMNAYVRSNSDGASAVWVLGGDGATA